MKQLNEYFEVDKLIDYYGITTDYTNCGYILPNGIMLNYKKNGKIYEHFEVEQFYKKEKCDCVIGSDHKPVCGNKPKCKYSVRKFFLYFGAARCIPDSSVILNIASSKCNKNTIMGYIENCIFVLKKDLMVEIQKLKKSPHEGELQLYDIKTFNIEINIDNYDSNIYYKIERLING